MKVSTDEVGINVTWNQAAHPKTMRPLRAVRVVSAAVGILMLCLAVTTSSALFLAIDLIAVFLNAVAVTFQTYVIRKADGRRSRRGRLRFSELPGFVWILLAGPEYWKAAGRILERRAKKAEAAVVPSSKPPMSALPSAACGLLGPLPDGYAPRRANCMGCGSPDPRAGGRCTDCYRQWRRQAARS